MEPKKEEPKEIIKTRISPKNNKKNTINKTTNTNNINIKAKTTKSNRPPKDSRQYNVQLTILEESQKLKINLEITDGPKLKRIYIKTLTLDELISLNNFFSQFNEYSEAFYFLLKNFTKIDRNKILYSNNNNDITIILLFSLGEDNNGTIEESIEVTLHRYIGNKINKSLNNINMVINNLKASLEKFNLSIKEVKSDINKDKEENDKRINELEQNVYNKLDELKQEIILINKENEDKESLNLKFEDVYNKIDEQVINLEDMKKIIEENNINQNEKINKNNNIFLEKEDELGKLITEKFNDIIGRINSYDEKSIEMENNFNDKLADLDNKTNICFNELIKKINIKNNNNKSFAEDDLKEELNEAINGLLEENENLEKRIENKLEEKINDIMMNKIMILEQKLNNLENNSASKKENEENNKDEQYNNLNSLFKEKFEELEQFKINILSDIEANKYSINENKQEINNINEHINKIYQEKEQNTNIEIDIENIKNYVDKEINDLREENEKNIENIKNKIRLDIEEQNKKYYNKIEIAKNELKSMMNNLNEFIKNNINDLNNKIQLLKPDILKTFDEKNILNDSKIESLENKLSSIETKINNIPDNNQKFFDNNNNVQNFEQKAKLTEHKTDINEKYRNKYLSRTLNTKFPLKKSKIQPSKNNNNILLTEINVENPNNISDIESDSSNKNKIRNSYFISSSNLNSSRSKERSKVFDLSIDSNILKPEDITENFFIFKKLKEIYSYNRYIKLNLIYRASRDGDYAKDFHFKCDFIGPNLTLIKTKKDYIFGGFTIKTWKHLFKDINNEDPENGTELKDEQAFGFYLNEKKIYENGKKNEEIIYCNSNYGPCFKNFFFKVFDKCFEKGGICGNIQESNFIGIEQDFEYNGGEQNFEVDEIEVFQIAFR